MHPRSLLPCLLLTLAAIAATAPAPLLAAPEFDVETIAGATAGQTAVAYDASGNLCIAYIDRPSTTNRLMFAEGSPGNWSISVVDTDVGSSLSLAISSTGTPYISYYYSTSADLRLASRPGTTWGHVTVDATGTVGSWSSLALDGSSRPVISYYGQGHLKVAAYNGASFTITTVDATNSTVGLYTSLKLYGTSSTRCISYYDAANGDLKYATNPGGTWTLTTVDSAGDVGAWSSLGLRVSLGVPYPRISYYDATNTALKQANLSGTTWSSAVVDNAADVGQMAYTYGVTAIAYWDATAQAVRYAYGGTNWTFHVVEPGVSCRNPSVVNDASGVPHLVYVANGSELHHAAGTRLWYDATTAAGIPDGPFRGAAWGDYDNDTWPDLYLPAYGASSRLLRNAIGSFQDVSASPLNTSSAWAAQWADYDNDGDIDLAVAGGPMMNLLGRNSGAAGGYAFTDVLNRGTSETTDDVAWVDENGDGAADLLLADYSLPNKLLRNQDAAGGWGFTDIASGSLLGVGATTGARVGAFTQDSGRFYIAMVKPQPGAGVKVVLRQSPGEFVDGPAVTPGGYPSSVAWGDYNGDGMQDLLVCRAQTGDPTSTAVLYRNDVTSFTRMSVPALEIPSLSAAWGDVDNDGDLDLFAGGYGVASRLLRNDSSPTTTVFTDATPTPVAVSGTIRGVAFADHDKDGDLDFIVAADGATSRLFRNDLKSGSHWLEIRLQGVGSNRSGVGARVDVAAGGLVQSREVGGGSAAHSQNMLTLHYGLGSATVADYVQVYWPRNGGEVQRLENVAADQILEIREPQTFTRTDLGALPSGIGFAGLAWGDMDADGDPDLATTSLGYLEQGPVIIFRNNAGVLAYDDSPGEMPGQGVAWGDYDNDRYPDLAASANTGFPEVMHNDGGHISAIPPSPRPPFGALSTWTGLTWFDRNNDGRLDLYAANTEASFFPSSANVLFQATPSWFEIATGTGLEIGGLSENAVCGDYDGDGDPDMLVLRTSSAYYPGSCMLMRNDGGVFTQVAAAAINAITAQAAAWGDYDNDRDLDVAIGDQLLRNDGGGTFTQVTVPDIHGGRSITWADYDLDGDLDLSHGGVLLRNDSGGLFVLDHDLYRSASGGEWADWDSDGDPDLALGAGRSLALLRNDQETGNHWFQVDLRGRTVNAMAIGTRVRIVSGGISQIREVSGGSGYYSQPEAVLSFGLGAATQVDSVVVRWTNGTVTTLTPATRNLVADQRLLVYEQLGPSPAPELPKALALASPWPNPANPSVWLRFELPAATTVRLKIYDVAGRLVAEPIAGETRDPGVHTIRWDGRSRDGTPAASGVYVLRLETTLGTRSTRMMLVR